MTFSRHIPRKRFGQHWLKDEDVLRKIINAADIQSQDRVLEIGPGRGALTEKLLNSRAALIHAIELDFDLINGLRKRFSDQPRFTLKQGDVLSVSLSPPDGRQVNKIVANIPYNITAPLLDRLLGRLGHPSETIYQRLVLLLQKEVADRIVANPGESAFSAMSVRMQLLANCSCICEVSPRCFKPSPKVHSKVVLIEPLREIDRLAVNVEKRIERLLKTAFLSRRKKIRNTLFNVSPISELEPLAKGLGISLDKRPQDLSLMQWISLASCLEEMS